MPALKKKSMVIAANVTNMATIVNQTIGPAKYRTSSSHTNPSTMGATSPITTSGTQALYTSD
eukprot:CAMPEP_0184357234 /NCGR_PEP_ID=MMETSP1089-20130417/107650_1 /TAXON_ID=38269 ORGANISM="Gloeochaete wittrockiana, Strain SAG46.84" /NCGR_SAMPLE_ID=MMETSP1089 /ASSEMBLY_ACC=CAM_ASM_000445 /LENGTH=61 /DNA_ID=CAMNT_0026694893 /DNA_START=87 /DNA_END=272 /DNA_ORIENTATION=+